MVSYLRLYADRDGTSHFGEVEFSFHEADFVPPAPPVTMTPLETADLFCFELVAPGWHGDWHPVPQRLLAVYLSGTGTIEASDGEVRDLLPGTILLAEDTSGKGSRQQGGRLRRDVGVDPDASGRRPRIGRSSAPAEQ